MTYSSGSDTTSTNNDTTPGVSVFADDKQVYIYTSFGDAPSPDEMNEAMAAAELLGRQVEYQVHPDNSTRKWKWDTTKWTLFGDTSLVGGIEFDAEVPIYQDLQETDGDGISVTHFFDMKDLKSL